MPNAPHSATAAVLSFPLPDLELVRVEGHREGEKFMMGGDRFDSEKPIHPVQIRYDFYMGRFQVTQALYEAVMGNNPSDFKGERRPVENVSWHDAKKMLDRLDGLEEIKQFLVDLKLPGATFRLPSEAEWEYAARGGRYSAQYEYCGADELKQVGWYDDNSGNQTQPAGLLLPNELGLYDMSGNVFEWCEDDWHGNYNGAPDDGSAWVDAPDRGAYRVIRGGYYWSRPVDCRPANRYHDGPDFRRHLGFRLVLAPS